MSDVVARFEAEYRAHRARLFAAAAVGWGLFLAAFVLAAIVSDLSPARLAEGVGRLGDFIVRMLPTLEADKLLQDKATEGSLLYWYYAWPKWLGLLWQTIEIAILSTFLGFTIAFFLSFLAARNLGVARPLVFGMRRFLELCRTVPELVTGLIFVFAFGTGPLAGVLAITIHTIGALGKLFSEVHENIDAKPVEGVTAAGGSWAEVMRYAVVPQVLASFASYGLLRFEINVGAAAAIGIVGAGGIGMELRSAIDFGLFSDALAIILMVVVVIFFIDFVSERIRHRLIGVGGRA